MLKNPKFILFLLFCSSLFGSCRDKWVDTTQYDLTEGKFLKEIPVTKEGLNKGQPDFFYGLRKSNSEALQLDTLESGFETLQIRIWLGHSMAIKRHVVILKLIERQWHADLIVYEQNNETTPPGIKVDTYLTDINPKNGWKNLIDSLHSLGIMNLLNADELPGYNGFGADGIGYFFEIATQNKYRFFYYANPKDNLNKFWQAKNVLVFSKLLEDEFYFTYTK